MSPEVDHIIALIRETGGIASVGPDDDFYEAGFSSINALNLLLELEAVYSIPIPDDRFVESRTPRSLTLMLSELTQGVSP